MREMYRGARVTEPRVVLEHAQHLRLRRQLLLRLLRLQGTRMASLTSSSGYCCHRAHYRHRILLCCKDLTSSSFAHKRMLTGDIIKLDGMLDWWALQDQVSNILHVIKVPSPLSRWERRQ